MSIWVKIAEQVTALGSDIVAGLRRIAGKSDAGPADPERSVGFTVGVIALGAKMAKADGAVTEREVKAFREVLGAAAVKRPRFDFRGATENADAFRRTAVAFEDLAVAAYKGQAPLIQRRAYLVPALAIHTVEARHAAWIRRLAGFTPAPDAFDEPRSKQSTLGIVAATRFEVMKTQSRSRPKFTG